jgi:predicted N-acetyltransferase YhbS
MLTEERRHDWWEVEQLFDLSFAPGRMLLSSYRLREGVRPVKPLCLVSRQDGVVGGAIRYWPVRIGDWPILLLGPVAVHPTRQGEGLGALLVQSSLSTAASLGHRRIMLVGDAPYYSRFGFRKLQNVTMPPPTNPERLLGLDLAPGAWDGICGRVEQALEPAGAIPSC